MDLIEQYTEMKPEARRTDLLNKLANQEYGKLFSELSDMKERAIILQTALTTTLEKLGPAHNHYSAINQIAYYAYNFDGFHLEETVRQMAIAENCTFEHLYNNYIRDRAEGGTITENVIWQFYRSSRREAKRIFIDRAIEFYEAKARKSGNPEFGQRI